MYLECGSFYERDGGPMAVVAETEQCQIFADECAASGKPLVNAGIVGHADLSLGAAVGAVLDAHMKSPNFRGIRDSCSWSDDPLVASHGAPPRKLYDPQFREGMVELGKRGKNVDFVLNILDFALT